MQMHGMVNMKRTFRAVLLAAASAGALATAAGAQTLPEHFYANKNYTYCDVKILAAYWKEPVVKDALFRAGRLIKRGQAEAVEFQINQARNHPLTRQVNCDVRDANNPVYTYSDYVALAAYWDKRYGKSPDNFKTRVVKLLERGENTQVIKDLAAARAAGF